VNNSVNRRNHKLWSDEFLLDTGIYTTFRKIEHLRRYLKQ